MEAKDKKAKKTTEKKEQQPKKKYSKTWLAMLANKDNPPIEIVDMRAVLK
ncbi:MAG: hypothetical protein QM564_00460 [Bergeyella sp.]